METKVKTTISLEKGLIKAVKQIALNKDTTQTEIINNYIRKGIENEKQTHKEIKSLNDIVGIIKGGEQMDSVKEVRKLRNKE
jgi:metal-responsive CopG/Arc/MetJ family transcriptional regulator